MSEQHRAAGRASQARRSPAERERLARIGGLTASAWGVAHRWTSEEAREAGRKGGVVAQRRRREREAEG